MVIWVVLFDISEAFLKDLNIVAAGKDPEPCRYLRRGSDSKRWRLLERE